MITILNTYIKHRCDKCNNELNWFIETKISDKITENVFKNSPLSYIPNIIYEIIEGNEYDVITYNYIIEYAKYWCRNCKMKHISYNF